jgi:hypothetical protein
MMRNVGVRKYAILSIEMFALAFFTAPSHGATTILDLQPHALSTTAVVAGSTVELINLNPNVSAQYLLRIKRRDYHLQAAAGTTMRLGTLGITYRIPGQPEHTCDLLADDGAELAAARGAPFNPICDGHIYVRQTLNGHKPGMAAHAEILRSWGGWTESLINGYKQARAQLGMVGDTAETRDGEGLVADAGALAPALVAPRYVDSVVRAGQLDIRLTDADANAMPVGRWVSASSHPGVHVSVIAPQHVAPEVMKSHRDRVNSLRTNGGGSQANKLAYLVALDLDRYTLGWKHGTQHPGVGWSRRSRVPRDPAAGPDGFKKLKPFVPVGAVSPVDLPLVVATFSGGFQRRHGAFRKGFRAKSHKGHHYGFVEDGVVLSTPMPHLASIVVDRLGTVGVRTWDESDDARMAELRYVRQNGVPIIEQGGPDSVGVPGPLVRNWVEGNWSGSADTQLMTPRSAACLLEEAGSRLLIFAYFSAHTPSGMARVLQAYRCDYAVHLDMNSPGQAYFALVTKTGDGLDYRVEHLVKRMKAVDAWVNKRRTPRYLLKADYRDLFYVLRKGEL